MIRAGIRFTFTILMAIYGIMGYSQRTISDFIGIDTVFWSTPVTTDSLDSVSDSIPKEPGILTYTEDAIRSLSSHVPTYHIISHEKSVGEIACHSNVSQMGSVELGVNIEGYENPLGFTPQIALRYSSFNGNGPLGYGWTLAGLSVISRGNKTIYYDSQTSSVQGDKNDAFFLDGKRLIRTSATSSLITYQTETGNIKVTATLNGSQNITYFKVWYPNGDIANYTTHDSNTFYISSAYDKDGCGVHYYYSYIGSHYRISSILYGRGNVGKILFSYTTNNDETAPVCYQNGSSITYNYLLKSIRTYYNNNELRRYDINYEDHQYVKLISSIDCSAGAESLNPLEFYYGDGLASVYLISHTSQLSRWFNFQQSGQIAVARGKFDYGNDNDCLLMYPNKLSYYEDTSDIIYRTINQYSNTDTILVTTGLNQPLSNWNPVLVAGTGFIDVFCADIDDDSGDEIIKINNTISGSAEQLKFSVYTSDLFTGIAHKYDRTFTLTGILSNCVIPKYFHTGDFNGDGRTDILAVTSADFLGINLGTKCFVLDLENNAVLYNGSPFSYHVALCSFGSTVRDGQQAFNESDKLFTMDYDGDGKTDVVIVKDDGTYVYSFSVSAGIWTCNYVGTYTQLTNSDVEDRNIMVGEFNGDGKHDLIISPLVNQGDTWAIHASKGNGQYDKRELSITARTQDAIFMLQDVNADGQTDLIKKWGYGIYVYPVSNLSQSQSYTTSDNSNVILVPVNIQSKNNWCSLVSIRNNGIAKSFKLNSDENKRRLMAGYADSFGLVRQFSYAYLNDEYSSVFSHSSGATFPYVNFKGALPVCSGMLTYYNNSLLSDVSMHYSNAVIHLQGLGFRGFQQVSSYDAVTGESHIASYAPYNFMTLLSEETNKASCNYTYDIQVATNRIAKVHMTEKSFYDKTNGVATNTIYAYDAYDNIIQEDTDYGGGNCSHLAKTYMNVINSQAYNLGLILTEQQTTDRNGQTFTVNVSNIYNSDRLVTSSERLANNLRTSLEEYTYNSTKLITGKSLKKYSSSTAASNSFAYNPYGQISARTDAFGFTESMTYNSKGLLSSTTDHLGNTTSTAYDEWGRTVCVNHPDGTTDSTIVAWSVGYDALFTVTRKSTGKPTVVSFFDALGNEIRRQEQSFSGGWLTSVMQYDSKKRLVRASYPSKYDQSRWTEYSYDGYDRLTSQVYASGKADSYSYSGLTKTVVKDGISTTYTYNTLGDVVSVTDPSGTIQYTYNGEGSPKQIVAPGNVVTTIVYDTYGRKVSMTDPSAGVSTVEYDDAGNVCRTVDARGKVVLSAYDSYDRLVSRQFVGDLTATYTYDSDNHLVSETNSDGTSTVYTYDALERLSSQRNNGLDGTWLQKSYTYQDGDIHTIGYSSQSGSITTEQYNYQNGYLESVVCDGDKNVYQRLYEDDYGRETGARLYKGLRSTTYDNEGRITALNTYYLNFGGDYSYAYDSATGNLLSRTDNRRNLTETFEYDALNRLTAFGGEHISYDVRGNITHNSLVGDYVYDSQHPYAVSGLYMGRPLMSTDSQSMTFNALGRVATLTEHQKTVTFSYNADGQRIKSVDHDVQSGSTVTKHYFGSKYEIVTSGNNTKEIFYVGGDAYTATAVLVRTDGGTWKLHTVFRDLLGSITHVVNESGVLVQELSYDAWGNLRDPATHQLYGHDDMPELFLGRGYTGHEHLTAFGLINMNARLYDPLLGRFVSPDPYVQEGTFSQSYNRYAYCMNNPFARIDRSGEMAPLVIVLVAAGVGSVISVGGQAIAGNIHSFGDFCKAAATGAVAGAVGSAAVLACGITAVGFIGGAMAGAVGGFTGALASEAFTYFVYGDAFNMGNVVLGTLGGAVTGGLVGGIYSVVKGGNFWTGEIKGGTISSQTSCTSETAAQEAQTAETSAGKSYAKPETEAVSLETKSDLMDASTQKVLTDVETEGNNTVYLGRDSEGTVRYVGITEREPNIRISEHLRSQTLRANLKYEVVPDATGLSRINARIIEQNFINQYGLGKTGGQLFNKINSIAPQKWNKYGITILRINF